VGKISRVSKQDFNRVLGQTRMLAANQQIAYAVLVDGKTQAEVAEDTGQSRSSIQRIVEHARGYIELSMADDGSTWVRVDVDMSKSLVEAWAVLSGELMRYKAPKVSQAIIGRVLNAIDHGTKTLKATKRA
jgi:DNA-binding transcriptional regulator LsrR (DeoR family)